MFIFQNILVQIKCKNSQPYYSLASFTECKLRYDEPHIKNGVNINKLLD